MRIFRFKDRGPFVGREVEVVDDDYTDALGTTIKFPHCDSLILHSPGVCEYCDRHPDWQALRSAQGIAFSDTPEADVKAHNLIPCPSTTRRPAEVRDRWYGNVPKSTS